jgi:hypothetical protein
MRWGGGGHEGGAFINVISVLIQVPRELASSLLCADMARRFLSLNRKPLPDTKSAGTFILNFSVSQTVVNKGLLFKLPSLAALEPDTHLSPQDF